MTPFGAILKQTVQASPTAIGGAFAASDGEMVDSFATMDPHDWAVLTATACGLLLFAARARPRRSS